MASKINHEIWTFKVNFLCYHIDRISKKHFATFDFFVKMRLVSAVLLIKLELTGLPVAPFPPSSYGLVWYFMWFSMAVQCSAACVRINFNSHVLYFFFFLRDDCIQMRENCLCHYMQFNYVKTIQFFFFVYPNPCFILQDVKEQLNIVLIWVWSLHNKFTKLQKNRNFYSEKVGIKSYLGTYLIY